MNWDNVGYGLLMLFCCWGIWKITTKRKDLFTSANMWQSAHVLGILAIILIAFIALLVMMLNQTS
jgi:hypothetical protein